MDRVWNRGGGDISGRAYGQKSLLRRNRDSDTSTVCTWFAFRHMFRRKAEKLERTNLNYGALARLTRDGGFWV